MHIITFLKKNMKQILMCVLFILAFFILRQLTREGIGGPGGPAPGPGPGSRGGPGDNRGDGPGSRGDGPGGGPSGGRGDGPSSGRGGGDGNKGDSGGGSDSGGGDATSSPGPNKYEEDIIITEDDMNSNSLEERRTSTIEGSESDEGVVDESNYVHIETNKINNTPPPPETVTNTQAPQGAQSKKCIKKIQKKQKLNDKKKLSRKQNKKMRKYTKYIEKHCTN